MSAATPTPAIVRLTRQRLLLLMRDRLPEMVHLFDVMHLRLFGSAVRDELRDDSDVDVLVEFNTAATYSRYMGLKFYLEDLLGRRIDLVTTKGLRQEFRPTVEQEAIVVA
jgi:predicted nucleotidyltransferase